MELVRGIKISDYCDQNNLPTRERLDLCIKVCQAIQHAHQKSSEKHHEPFALCLQPLRAYAEEGGWVGAW